MTGLNFVCQDFYEGNLCPQQITINRIVLKNLMTLINNLFSKKIECNNSREKLLFYYNQISLLEDEILKNIEKDPNNTFFFRGNHETNYFGIYSLYSKKRAIFMDLEHKTHTELSKTSDLRLRYDLDLDGRLGQICTSTYRRVQESINTVYKIQECLDDLRKDLGRSKEEIFWKDFICLYIKIHFSTLQFEHDINQLFFMKQMFKVPAIFDVIHTEKLKFVFSINNKSTKNNEELLFLISGKIKKMLNKFVLDAGEEKLLRILTSVWAPLRHVYTWRVESTENKRIKSVPASSNDNLSPILALEIAFYLVYDEKKNAVLQSCPERENKIDDMVSLIADQILGSKINKTHFASLQCYLLHNTQFTDLESVQISRKHHTSDSVAEDRSIVLHLPLEQQQHIIGSIITAEIRNIDRHRILNLLLSRINYVAAASVFLISIVVVAHRNKKYLSQHHLKEYSKFF